MLNPMHRLWSDGRWNKLTVAHGCYWKKCSFCDVSLDYISRYEAASASTLVDRIEKIVAETGQTGFHFVDEAAPPKALKTLAKELLRRKVHISWWGNIRFEKTFTPELAELLAESGCIAMSGGLEVASDRLLNLMKKGVSVGFPRKLCKTLWMHLSTCVNSLRTVAFKAASFIALRARCIHLSARAPQSMVCKLCRCPK
jgi:radical SAM superfamily enzyme YgiQ (UPF0313 family)